MPGPSPRTWTLRFKLHRTTILLHSDPQQRLSLLRAELLTALQITHSHGFVEGKNGTTYSIPESYEDIVLAKLRDPNDVQSGWERLIKPAGKDFGFEDEGVSAKGKGKAGALKSAGKGGVSECPQGVGLRDGAVVAFRFMTVEEKEKRSAAGDEADEDVDEIAKKGVDEEEKEVWDVEMPTIESTYGEEDGQPGLEDEQIME